jgi:hypothetical protein
MRHFTLGRLRALLANLGEASDEMEVRFYLDHGEHEDETFGRVTSWIVSPEEDGGEEEGGSPLYLGLRIEDTGDLS